MKAFIRKSSASFFLFLCLGPLLISFSFVVREIIIQHRMKKMLESHALQTVMIPEKEVVWMDDHEIWVNESMFDIRTKKLENGVYTFTGMYDEDETDLVRQQKGLHGDLSDDHFVFVKLLIQMQALFYEEEGDIMNFDQEDALEMNIVSSLYTTIRPVCTPPPDRIGHTC